MSTSTVTVPNQATAEPADSMRERFYAIVPDLLDDNPSAALVLAVIGSGYLDPRTKARLADRIIVTADSISMIAEASATGKPPTKR